MSSGGIDCCERLWNLHHSRFLQSRSDKHLPGITCAPLLLCASQKWAAQPLEALQLYNPKKAPILISWVFDCVGNLSGLLSDI